jgi:hypothetical protein
MPVAAAEGTISLLLLIDSVLALSVIVNWPGPGSAVLGEASGAPAAVVNSSRRSHTTALEKAR